jgi:hypothetical protein
MDHCQDSHIVMVYYRVINAVVLSFIVLTDSDSERRCVKCKGWHSSGL